MSLYLPEQKLGSHSQEGTASQKFILKGRQTGSMHRGHTWVFRAESHDTMMAWYADIKVLTERTPQQRSEMFGLLNRSGSRASRRSTSSDARAVEEEDDTPFAAAESVDVSVKDGTTLRPQAGGRFPSDIQVNAQRGMEVGGGGSPASGDSGVANGAASFAGGDPRDAGSVYGAPSAYGITPAPPDEPVHVAVAHPSNDHLYADEASDNPYSNEGIYHPKPIHGAPTAIYQYQTPSRNNSYAEAAPDGQGGSYFPGQGGASQGLHPDSCHEAGVGQNAPGGQQMKDTPTVAPTPADAINTTGEQPGTTGEQGTEDAPTPTQGVSRASTNTSMHIPGDFPKNAAQPSSGNGAGQK
ncbi:hypothetical protein IMZ48_25170 [Candidatus Bathyarchaeota archaeon]|nr:hypothetical protein [Candidatus Bathyarchaeota archaeon]